MAEYPTIKADDRGTDITFRTLLLQQLPQDNPKTEREAWGGGRERKQNYPGFIVERTGWWLEIAIIVSIINFCFGLLPLYKSEQSIPYNL